MWSSPFFLKGLSRDSVPSAFSLCHKASNLQNIQIVPRSLNNPKCSCPFIIFLFLVLTFLGAFAPPCLAEWTLDVRSHVFYTDDIALFSPTQRLTRHQDPTQPAIDRDLANQDDGFVYEPMAEVSTSFDFMGRKSGLRVRGQGFVFVDNSRFNHGSLGVEANHDLTSSTNLKLAYFFGPDLFLGRNEVRVPEEGLGEPLRFKDEEFSTHYWVGKLDQQLPGANDMTLRLLGRYGLRDYNKSFNQRDTKFWTIGTHLEWAVTHTVDFALGYHYERGLADGRHQSELNDDISYYSHFATGELEIDISEQLELELAVHYEFNGWTTGIEEDERKGEDETVVQGDIATSYQITDTIQLRVGFQAARRKESFEDKLTNYNISVGAKKVF